MDQSTPRRAKAIGINHIALEVGDIDAALDFYGAFLDFEVARRSDSAAFVYFGDLSDAEQAELAAAGACPESLPAGTSLRKAVGPNPNPGIRTPPARG